MTTGLSRSPAAVVAFWRAAGRSRWFGKDRAFDALCRTRFLPIHEAAASGALDRWSEAPDGALALAILLDQLPRNMFRGSPRTYATDGRALALSELALARRFDWRVTSVMRQFFYLPFMHAEDVATQERSLALYEAHGDAHAARFARHHHDIVARFGRFPHRNAILGRESTPDEIAFLARDPFRG